MCNKCVVKSGRKLDIVYESMQVSHHKGRNVVDDVQTVQGGYYDMPGVVGWSEYGNIIDRLMNRYGIGNKLSFRKWGQGRVGEIQDMLRQSMRRIFIQQDKPKSQIQLYNDLRGDKRFDNYSPGEIAVAVRTETAKMRVLYQLLEYQRAGIEEVRYVTKGDDKVRSTHRAMNGKIFRVDWLLKPENENQRIPLNESPYNCRCKYQPYMRGFD